MPASNAKKNPVPPQLKGQGGAGRGQGRKPGVMNEKTIKKIQSFASNAAMARELAAPFLEGAIKTLAIQAGAMAVPLLVRSGPKKGQPKVEPLFNEDGSPKLDDAGNQIHGPVMVFMPAESEAARTSAATKLIELVAGKASQPLANDPDNPITDIKPSGKVIFGWPEGYAPPKDGKNRVLPHEVAQPANDDDEGSAEEPEEKNT